MNLQLLEEVLAQLEAKKVYFQEYEKVTIQFLDADVDEMELLAEQRQDLIDQIDLCDGCISSLLSGNPNEQIVLDAIKNRMDFNLLPAEFVPVWQIGQDIFGIANRIRSIDPQIISTMKNIKDEIQKKLEQTNQTRKLTNYFKTLDGSFDAGTLYNKKK